MKKVASILSLLVSLLVHHSLVVSSFPVVQHSNIVRRRRQPNNAARLPTNVVCAAKQQNSEEEEEQPQQQQQQQQDQDQRERMLESILGFDPRQYSNALLDYSIDSFLRGDYDQPFSDDAPAPLPGLTPGGTVDAALRSLRQLDEPEPSHGAAVLLRFCASLSRGERWGSAAVASNDENQQISWKELIRGALTPTMLARRIRASEEFSMLLDWSKLDVTDGAAMSSVRDEVPSVAFVSAAIYFEDGMEPALIQFKLRRIGGVWLIDSARRSENNLFMEQQEEEDTQ